MICTFNEYYSGDQIRKNEMEEACGTYWGEKSCVKGLGGETSGKQTT